MTRKDYELIARVFKQELDRADDRELAIGYIWPVASELSRALRSTNPRFDPSRFLTACGMAD